MKTFKRILKYAVISLCSLGLLLVATSFHHIYSSVKDICIEAKQTYHEPCVPSLISYVSDDTHPLIKRNHAVWALGQLADDAALPFLTELHASLMQESDADPTTKQLSTYEVYKAIKWCTEGNATSWMYKNREKW